MSDITGLEHRLREAAPVIFGRLELEHSDRALLLRLIGAARRYRDAVIGVEAFSSTDWRSVGEDVVMDFAEANDELLEARKALCALFAPEGEEG